jgi:ATP-dependent Clp protease adapter protein ClpS
MDAEKLVLMQSIRAKARQSLAEIWVADDDVTFADVVRRLLEKLTPTERGLLLEGAAAHMLYATNLPTTSVDSARLN